MKITSKLFYRKLIFLNLIIPRLILSANCSSPHLSVSEESNTLRQKSSFVVEGETPNSIVIQLMFKEIEKMLNKCENNVKKEYRYIISRITNGIKFSLFNKYFEYMNLFNIPGSDAQTKHENSGDRLVQSFRDYSCQIKRFSPEIINNFEVLLSKLSKILLNVSKLLYGENIDTPHKILQFDMLKIAYDEISRYLKTSDINDLFEDFMAIHSESDSNHKIVNLKKAIKTAIKISMKNHLV